MHPRSLHPDLDIHTISVILVRNVHIEDRSAHRTEILTLGVRSMSPEPCCQRRSISSSGHGICLGWSHGKRQSLSAIRISHGRWEV